LQANRIVIGLDKMAGGGRSIEGWGFKDMSEDEGPYEFNCPLHYLEKASPPEGFAIKWREKVRMYHAERADRTLPAKGLVVQHGDSCYRLEHPAARRGGWYVTRTTDGTRFRMPANQLAKAKFLTPELFRQKKPARRLAGFFSQFTGLLRDASA
jgi:hypothetical protein